MQIIKVRKLNIGEGIPKICVPIVGNTEAEIVEQAKEIMAVQMDLVEWRCDWYEDVLCKEKVMRIADNLRSILGDTPILFTFRTVEEGGAKKISMEQYLDLYKTVIASEKFDLVDVQIFLGDAVMKQLLEYAHSHDIKVVASNHDFEKTPEQKTIVDRLRHMQELGADIAKIAVMPQTEDDVRILLAATKEMSEQYAVGPIVTMAMSEIGRISRIEGENYGSAITFGSAKKASAPGQIPADELAELLHNVHRAKV